MRCAKCNSENSPGQKICGECGFALDQPSVSVVIVSDYASGLEAGWNDLRTTLKALAQQDFEEPVDFMLIESTELAGQIPSDFAAVLPALRVITAPQRTAYELKNTAVQAASTELVAMIDGDCAPSADWLRRLVDAMREHPDAVAISGKTVHAGNGLINRAMGAANRSYVEVGHAGTTGSVSSNNALFRRSAYLAHPLQFGPFASHLQSEAILRSGGRLLFEPRARVAHAYEGWATEWDFRRGSGFAVIRSCRIDPRLRYAWVTRLSYFSIPLFVARHILTGWWYCLIRGRGHGLVWYELPAAFALVAVASCMEAPGMLSALRDRPSAGTLFR
jgi:hypothetical protein